MFKARYNDPETGKEGFIASSEYDAEKHGSYHLSCPEDGCCAPVNFRKGSLAEGNANPRRAHFYTLDRSEHNESCPVLDDEYEPEVRFSCSIREAVQRGLAIMLNANFKTSLNVAASFNPKSKYHSVNPYQKWLVENPHISEACHNAGVMLKHLNTIMEYGGVPALRYTKIGHSGRLRCADEIITHCDDPYATQNIIRELEDDFIAMPGLKTAHGFPRLMVFQPSYASLKSVGEQHISSAADYNGFTHRLELPPYEPNHAHDTDFINAGQPLCVFAAPMLRDGHKTIEWRVLSQDMICPAQGPVIDLVTPDPALLVRTPKTKRARKTDTKQMSLFGRPHHR